MKVRALVFGALLLTLPALGEKVKTIRVAPLASDQPMAQPLANSLTAKLISSLAAAGVSVLEGPSDTPTDAVLTVSYATNGYQFTGPVRLTDLDGKVVWADEVRSTRFARNPSTSFAENVARKVEAFLSTQK